ncbi:hypothetical protein ASG32_08260 [Methylobacterium sp. Leaf361]|uniref:hypothetical protein n=1 Tax=Methylobacterium sp. Leaf361 TaxID=1736352 RepID=UPI0006FCCC51|nr:hypothetical protein [Methylobacterium sp. Leaf361]KQS75081.1 hypothetical protein ASG32_08260 [Methylobacterium sp. Leaf361]
MRITAQAVAFSSVVGSSITLHNEAGAVVGMLGLMNATQARTPEEMTAFAERIAAAINAGQAERQVRHFKNGRTYDVIAEKALFQVSYKTEEMGRANTRAIHDGQPVTVYRNEHGTFVRFPDEMVPPRFKEI